MGPVANIELTLRMVTVTVPVAVYFLLLGLLNTRRHPQMLTARTDFLLLLVALSPLVLLPAAAIFGSSPAALVAVALAIAGGIILLAPTGSSWVVYNLPAASAWSAIASSLGALGLGFQRNGDACVIDGRGATVTVEAFPLLRNVTVRLSGGDRDLAAQFHQSLAGQLGHVECEASPMAVSMLLVAMAILAAPLAMAAGDAPQLVRILTDLLY